METNQAIGRLTDVIETLTLKLAPVLNKNLATCSEGAMEACGDPVAPRSLLAEELFSQGRLLNEQAQALNFLCSIIAL